MTRTDYLTRTAAPAEGRVLGASLELRDVDASHRYLEGRAVPYGVQADIGYFIETFERGAFAKSIREAANGLPLLLFHDRSSLDSLIGVAESWREEADGLHGVWRLEQHDSAQRAAAAAKSGTLGYMSIGFAPIRSQTVYAEDDGGDRIYITRQEARLLETSLVSTPAYKEAEISKVRSHEVSLSREVAGREVAGWQAYLDQVRG